MLGQPRVLILVALGAAILFVALPAAAARPDSSVEDDRIAFTHQGDIWTMAPDGSDQVELTSWFGFEQESAWSPDGTKIAFARDVTGGDEFHIFLVNADGSGEVDLTPDARTSNRGPTWSPDGSKIAYIAVHPQGAWFKLIVMNSDGSMPRALPLPDSFPWQPSWSPVGNQIAFEEDQLWVTNLRGDLRRLTDTVRGGDHTPSWAPEGNVIVFVHSGDAFEVIATITRSGAIQQLTFGPERDREPVWSPDGTRIAFTRGSNIWTMASDGTDQVQITISSDDEDPAWQPGP